MNYMLSSINMSKTHKIFDAEGLFLLDGEWNHLNSAIKNNYTG